MSNWRNIAKPIIATCLFNHRGESEQEIRRALREVYPFGPRQYHPYKIWCDEIQRQRGLKPPLGHWKGRGKKPVEPDPRQEEMFV
jgi:hypothetical protein